MYNPPPSKHRRLIFVAATLFVFGLSLATTYVIATYLF